MACIPMVQNEIFFWAPQKIVEQILWTSMNECKLLTEVSAMHTELQRSFPASTVIRVNFEDGCLLGCSTTLSGRRLPTFQRSLLPPSSGWWVAVTSEISQWQMSDISSPWWWRQQGPLKCWWTSTDYMVLQPRRQS
jgi:hypothetical protein